ncbi:MAG: hypothetical protein KF808_07165 [Cryobacterium sp.]|nr:hypothetical protein [Cryobacterium sp.]
MNRPTSALFAALEAVLVAGTGLGIAIVPLSAVWAIQYGFQPDWLIFWRAAADFWLIGHGVDFSFTISQAIPDLQGAEQPFPVTIALLGVALLTLLLSIRTGRRLDQLRFSRLATLVAVLTFGLLSLGVTFSARHDLALPSRFQGVLLPTAVFALGMFIGRLRSGLRSGRGSKRVPGQKTADGASRLRGWWLNQPALHRAVLVEGVRGGVAAILLLLAASAIVLAVSIGVNFGRIVALYEAVHGEVFGGIALTVGQIFLLPNLIVWAASWLIGPGFAIGVGSSVGPLGVNLGPLPALPLFGAIPEGQNEVGYFVLAVPLLIAFLVGVLVRRRIEARAIQAPGTVHFLSTGLVMAISGGLLAALLSLWSGGAAGPGRLQQVGPDFLQVLIWMTLELAIAGTLGVLSGRTRPSK